MANGLTYARALSNTVETDALARTLAPLLMPGDAIVLSGDLGAGKTRFFQGVARALGVTEPVTSPTFTIQLSYQAEGIVLNHFDLYRLDDPGQLDDIGYWEVLEGDGASFVEWADKFPHHLPADFLELSFEVNPDGTRTVTAHSYGDRARRLLFIWAGEDEARWQKVD